MNGTSACGWDGNGGRECDCGRSCVSSFSFMRVFYCFVIMTIFPSSVSRCVECVWFWIPPTLSPLRFPSSIPSPPPTLHLTFISFTPLFFIIFCPSSSTSPRLPSFFLPSCSACSFFPPAPTPESRRHNYLICTLEYMNFVSAFVAY